MATSLYLIAGSTYTFHLAPTSNVGGAFSIPFGSSYTESTSAPVSARFIGDYNSDGKADVIAYDGASAHVMLGNGTGTFSAAQIANLAAAHAAYEVELAILEFQDWQFFAGGWTPNLDTDHANEAISFSGTSVSIDYRFLGTNLTYNTGHTISDSATADVNGDGVTDMVFVNTDNTITVLLHDNTAGTPVITNIDTAAAITLVGYNSLTGAPLSGFMVSNLPSNGTLYSDAALTQAITTSTMIAASGDAATVYFKPNAGWTGSTGVQYVAVDGAGNTSIYPITQQVQVTLVNDVAPTLTGAAAVLAAGTEDVAMTLTSAQLLTGWTDPDAGQTLTVTTVSSNHGAVVSNGNGTWTLTPTANYNGAVTFSYGVSDGILTTAATLSTNLAAVNDAPTLGAAATLAAGAEDSAYSVTAAQLLSGWSDVDGDTPSVAGTTVTADHGSVSYDAGSNSYTITPDADYNGPVTLSYSVSDGTATLATTRGFTLAAVNDIPTLAIAATLVDGTEDITYVVTASELLSGWSDVDGTPLTVAGNTVAADHGSVSYDAGSDSYTVTPDANYNGPVTLSYGVSDGTASVSANLGFNLGAVNDLPTQGTNDPLGDGTEDVAYQFTGTQLLSDWSDADGDTLAVASNVITADHGSVSYDAGTDTYTITPDANYNGPVLLNFGVDDGTTVVAGGLGFNLVAVNDAPILGTAATLADGTENVDFIVRAADLLQGYTDIDGGTIALGVLSADHATVGPYDPGTDSYTLTVEDNYAGQLTLSYSVNDGQGGSIAAARSLNLAASTRARSSVDYVLDNTKVSLLLTGSAIAGTGNELANTLTGNSGNNLLIGGGGSDTINAGSGVDTMAGGLGNDVFFVDNTGDVVVEVVNEGTDLVQSFVSYTLSANVEQLILVGAAAIDGTGNDLANFLVGNVAANVLSGGAGNDTYTVGVGDTVVEEAGQGTDLVQSAVSWTLSANVENLTLTGAAAVDATGNDLANVIKGNAGANVLSGGAGNDSYVVGAGDTVVEQAGEGTDTVLSSDSWTLSANIENLTLTGTASVDATGNDLNNTLTGNSGNNQITGGAGNDSINAGSGVDTVAGGLGNDLYFVDNMADVVMELAGEGSDVVQAFASFTLGANLETLVLVGSAAIDGTGNELGNLLLGNAAGNILSGGGGNDVLNGAAGADTMIGGLGIDRYVVDNVGDVIIEAPGEGVDLVEASVSHILGANVENLTLTGAAAINATGNELANMLTGNGAANVLSGAGGHDTYVVGAGDTVVELAGEGTDLVQSSVSWTLSANVENLTLTGVAAVAGTGNDLANVLTGNSAANLLSGGMGNDMYVVGSGDTVLELADAGTDTVQSAVSWTLAANVENLTLTGTGAISGTGNDLANTITGNVSSNLLSGGGGNDTLNGGAGNDTMNGGQGNDLYFVDSSADVLVEAAGEGTDQVQASVSYTLGANVEQLFLIGSGAVDATGNTLANTLIGNAADNVISGGLGNDALRGGLGNDTFTFDTALSAVTNVDTIVDFTAGDHLQLSVDIFSTLTGGGALDAAQFFSGAGVTGSSGSGGIYYDTSTGSLYYDADGSGALASTRFAMLTGLPAVTSTDIFVG